MTNSQLTIWRGVITIEYMIVIVMFIIFLVWMGVVLIDNAIMMLPNDHYFKVAWRRITFRR